jgi:hypothetical protein
VYPGLDGGLETLGAVIWPSLAPCAGVALTSTPKEEVGSTPQAVKPYKGATNFGFIHFWDHHVYTLYCIMLDVYANYMPIVRNDERMYQVSCRVFTRNYGARSCMASCFTIIT